MPVAVVGVAINSLSPRSRWWIHHRWLVQELFLGIGILYKPILVAVIALRKVLYNQRMTGFSDATTPHRVNTKYLAANLESDNVNVDPSGVYPPLWSVGGRSEYHSPLTLDITWQLPTARSQHETHFWELVPVVFPGFYPGFTNMV